jgi:type 1 glutamine amidotransferase
MKLRTAVGAAFGLALATAFLCYHGAAASTQGKTMKHLLVVSVTKGFHHDSIPVADETIQMLGQKTGEWETDVVTTDEDLAAKTTPEALKKYDAVIFANTTGVLPLADPQGFLDYIKAGHGFGAMHSGADTFHEWPGAPAGTVSEYCKMLGAEFQTHHAQCRVEGRIVDPSFPACKALIAWQKKNKVSTPPESYSPTYVYKNQWRGYDEMYLYKNVDTANLHALVQMDVHPPDHSEHVDQEPAPWLISWCKAYGKGRVFYTSFGHRQEMWHDPLYQEYITGGIRWMLGLAKGSTTPNLH